MSVLFIYPPFAKVHGPYISIPHLSAFLMEKGVPVSAFDANSAFYRHFLNVGNVEKGMRYARERILELNGKPALGFSEMMELNRLAGTVSRGDSFLGKMRKTPESDRQETLWRSSGDLEAVVRLCTTPFFPAMADYMRDHISYVMGFSEYSSQDILDSIEHEEIYTAFMESEIPERVKEHKPAVVGISVPFPHQVIPAFKIAAIVKQTSPHVHVTMGGAFPSCHFRNLREPRIFDLVDSIILDHGEVPLLRLVRELRKPASDLGKVPSMMRRVRGTIQTTEPDAVPDLESLPVPDYRVFPLDGYFLPRKDILFPLRLSRGCQWRRCAFCMNKLDLLRKYHHPNIDLVYDRLLALHAQTGCQAVVFSEDAATPEMLEIISKRLVEDRIRLRWQTQTRISPALTLDRCIAFKKAGCIRLFFGVESYSNRLLKLIRKGISTRLIDQTLSNLSWAGLPAVVYMIAGLPTETEDEALSGFKKIQLMQQKGLIQRYRYSLFRILKYSDISEHPEKYGIRRLFEPPGLDLDPPIINFEGMGMSRERVLNLQMLKSERTDGLGLPSKITLGGKPFPLRYDLRKFRHMRFDYEKNRILTAMPVRKWLAMGEETWPRFRPSSP
ncbi:MAG: radical SAM protein [Deltaproteobacteria bacterium]|nr:radical SAM protein [Deltaproteobacteria bacterium]